MEVKHKQFCKENAEERKLKGDSKVRRQNQEKHFKKVILPLSELGSFCPFEDAVKVAQSCQNLGSKGDVKKSRAKGGRLPKTGKIEVSVQGGEDVVDRQVKEDSKVERLKQEEYCEEPKEALKVVQTSPQNIV